MLAAALLALLVDCTVGPVAAEVYECRGADGKTVLTNRPKGLRGCVLVETLTPSVPGRGGSPPATHRADPGQEEPMPLPVPLPVPPWPPQGMPEAHSPDVPDTPAADAKVGDDSPCLPQVNPLNPLSGRACPPAAADSAKPETPPGN